jgi:hypothetical protein
MCDDANTYCCGTGPTGSYDRAPNNTCCNITELVFKAESAYPFTSLSPSPSSTPIVLSGSSSGPVSATATTTDNPNTASASYTTSASNSSSSHNNSIAIGVVAAIATVSLAALCYMLWKSRRQKAQVAAAAQPQETYQEHPKAILELEAKNDNTPLSPREMNTTYDAQELYGDVVNPVESLKQT